MNHNIGPLHYRADQIVLTPQADHYYPCREDRLYTPPSAQNAQGLFSPHACVFVGSLSTKTPLNILERDLKTLLSRHGPCHVRIKTDKNKGLPVAFVQFETVDAANAAIANNPPAHLHGRMLRPERSRGKRTAIFGRRSLAPVDASDLQSALNGCGCIEGYRFESFYLHSINYWVMVCKLTFAFVDDCLDAVACFKHNPIFYLYFLDIEGSPWQHEQPHIQPIEPVRPNKKVAFKAQEVTTKENKESKIETTDAVQDVSDGISQRGANKSVDRIDSANSSPPAETSKQDETNTEPEEWGFRVPIAGVTSSHTAPDDMQSSKTTWEVEPLRRYVSAG